MVELTGVGIYIVIIYVWGIGTNLYYAGKGEVVYTRGVLIFASLWSVVNLWLLLNYGFNV